MSKIFRTNAENIKDKYPILYHMYDPCDIEHTMGSSDYFLDQLEELLSESESVEDIKEIEKTIEFVSSFEEIEIY